MFNIYNEKGLPLKQALGLAGIKPAIGGFVIYPQSGEGEKISLRNT